jgi:hypothetical protein
MVASFERSMLTSKSRSVLLRLASVLERSFETGWLLGIDQENAKIPFYRLASGLEKLMLSSSQEINVDKEDLEILQFIQVEGSNPSSDLSFFSLS